MRKSKRRLEKNSETEHFRRDFIYFIKFISFSSLRTKSRGNVGTVSTVGLP